MGLVLSRKKDEEIVITVPGLDEPIVILCVDIESTKTRLRISAPRSVKIHRKEVQEIIDAQKL
jgi:carbon storage regulator